MLHGDLVPVPVVVQDAVMVDKIAHPLPRQMGRTCVKFIYFLLREAQALPYADGNSFRCRQGQGHVDAVQGHPVDFPLPAFPCPVGHGIAVSDGIEVIMMAERGGNPAPGGIRNPGRPADVLVIPGNHAQSVCFEKIVKSAAKGRSAAAAYGQDPAGGLRLKNITAVFLFDGFQLEFAGDGFQGGDGPFHDGTGRLPFFR